MRHTPFQHPSFLHCFFLIKFHYLVFSISYNRFESKYHSPLLIFFSCSSSNQNLSLYSHITSLLFFLVFQKSSSFSFFTIFHSFFFLKCPSSPSFLCFLLLPLSPPDTTSAEKSKKCLPLITTTKSPSLNIAQAD